MLKRLTITASIIIFLGMYEFYCVFCKESAEDAVETFLEEQGYTVIPALMERIVFKRKQPMREIRRLLPGAVFFESLRPPDWVAIQRCEQSIHPLRYAEAVEEVSKGKELPQRYTYYLRNRELDFVQWLMRQKGLIKISKAVREGTRIVMVEGPLKELESRIVKINTRHQCAAVAVRLGVAVSLIWLFYTMKKD